MKKALIFVMVALMALASTGCGTSAFMSAQRDSRELRGYTQEFGQRGNKQDIIQNIHKRAENEDKIVVIGRATAYNGDVDGVIAQATMSARSKYAKDVNSNTFVVEKLTTSKSGSNFNSVTNTEANAHTDIENFEPVATFKKERGNKVSVICYFLCSKQ